MIIRTRTEVTATLWEDWEVEPIPEEVKELVTSHFLPLFDYATTHGTHDWIGHPSLPVRVAIEVENEETVLIEDAYIVDPDDIERMGLPLDFISRKVCIEEIKALPEDGANKSRDAGRGYAQAIKDVLRLLGGTDD